MSVRPRATSAAGALALHARGTNHEMRVRIAAAEHLDDVANRRAVERRHDADLARQRGKRALARGVEEPFGLQPPLQLIEGELQRAEPMRLHVLADDLVFALRLVHADAPPHDDVQAVLGLELQRADVRLEHHRLDLRAGILQREIEMAGVPEPAVGNFCLDPDLGVRVLQNAADVRGEVADSEDSPLTFASRRRCRLGRFAGRFRFRFRFRFGVPKRSNSELMFEFFGGQAQALNRRRLAGRFVRSNQNAVQARIARTPSPFAPACRAETCR